MAELDREVAAPKVEAWLDAEKQLEEGYETGYLEDANQGHMMELGAIEVEKAPEERMKRELQTAKKKWDEACSLVNTQAQNNVSGVFSVCVGSHSKRHSMTPGGNRYPISMRCMKCPSMAVDVIRLPLVSDSTFNFPMLPTTLLPALALPVVVPLGAWVFPGLGGVRACVGSARQNK